MPETTETKIPAEAVSLDIAAEKRKQLLEVLPEAFSDGKLDLDALKMTLGEGSVIESGERYALTWAGKGDAYKVLQTPTTATLRPQRDLSVNFDEAQHVFIEGENLEALKVLQKAYFGAVKLIYIDPPYNTGSDSFIYPDRFQESNQTLYFVAETKGTGEKTGVQLTALRPLEQLKIECGKRHFKQFEQVRFKVVKSLGELIA